MNRFSTVGCGSPSLNAPWLPSEPVCVAIRNQHCDMQGTLATAVTPAADEAAQTLFSLAPRASGLVQTSDSGTFHFCPAAGLNRPSNRSSCGRDFILAMATATASTRAPSAASAVATSQAARTHDAPARPVANASFVNSELFSRTAGLSARAVGAPLPVTSRCACVPAVCKISKGDIVPPVEGLKDQDGKLVNLDKFRGKPLVLYFYPADETPGCTKQACAFRDSYEEFKLAGAEVVGVSGDTPESHRAFKARYRLPFTLLSDEGNRLRKDWGVPSDLFGALAGRQTYVIDKDGRVQLIFNNQFEPEKHILETLSVLQG